MTKEQIIKTFKELKLCRTGILWYSWTSGSPEDLWNRCHRGDWLLLLLSKIIPDYSSERRLCLTAIKCARVGIPEDNIQKQMALELIKKAENWLNENRNDFDIRSFAEKAALLSAAGEKQINLYDKIKPILKRCADLVREDWTWSEIETFLIWRG